MSDLFDLELIERRPPPRVPRHPQNGFHPQIGMRVRVTGGRFEGQFGEITHRYPSHVYVLLDGHILDVLVLLRHLEEVEQLEKPEAAEEAEETALSAGNNGETAS